METMEKLDLSKFGLSSAQPFDPAAHNQVRADTFNRTPGTETGYDCPKCLNRGINAYVKEDGNLAFGDCACMNVRRFLRKMEKSGLKNTIEEMTFDKFRTEEPWQEQIKTQAMDYAEHMDGWLLFCGQPGSGKSHLCTAVCRHRLLQGTQVRYMAWRDDISRLKALSLDSEERGRLLCDLKTAPILYIDDLFKTGRATDGSDNPTGADVNLAFEVINYRYNNHLPTILSTEKTPQELLAIDEATASRIIQRAMGHTIQICRNPQRNYRLRGVVTV